MREIKFRGLRKDNGQWIYGFPDSRRGGKTPTHILETGNCFENEFGMYCGHTEPIVEGTIGQFTGLLDKNGKEIFEGDILKLWRSVGSNGRLRGEYLRPLPVVYEPMWCQFVLDDDENKMLYGIWTDFQAFEVIGNIYESPELLKGDNK